MTNTEELKALLKNAIAEGFTSEDIEDLARDIEAEQEDAEMHEDLLNDLQQTAAEALVDFLEEIDYFDEDTDYADDVDAIYDALQLVREGKLKVNVKNCGNSCSCSTSCHDAKAELDEALKRLIKLWES